MTSLGLSGHSQAKFALINSDVYIRVPDFYWETSLRDEDRLNSAVFILFTASYPAKSGNRPAAWSPKY